MKTTGTLLKEAREKQNLSISEVSMSTKINPKVISAIEDGREGQLPAKTFLKGFVRSYAIYLKLDVEQVMATLQQDLGEKQEPVNEPSPATAQPEKIESPSISANPKVLKGLAAGGVLFLIVMIVTVKGLVEKYEKEKALDPAVQAEIKTEAPPPTEVVTEKAPEAPAADAAKADTAKDAAKPEEAKTAEATKPTETAASQPVAAAPQPTAPPAKVEPPAKPAETVAATPAPEVKKPEVKPEPKPEVKVEAKPAAPVAAAPVPPKVEPPKPAAPAVTPQPATVAATSGLKDNEIILEALDKVDIAFAVNNGPVQKISLQPSQVHTIKAKGQVAMDVSDGGAVNVILNGQDNGTVGDLGKPKKMKYP